MSTRARLLYLEHHHVTVRYMRYWYNIPVHVRKHALHWQALWLFLGGLAANTARSRGRIATGGQAGRACHQVAYGHEPSWCKLHGDREDVDFENSFTKRVTGILCAMPGTARLRGCQNPVP